MCGYSAGASAPTTVCSLGCELMLRGALLDEAAAVGVGASPSAVAAPTSAPPSPPRSFRDVFARDAFLARYGGQPALTGAIPYGANFGLSGGPRLLSEVGRDGVLRKDLACEH